MGKLLDFNRLKIEILSGMTVAIALVPEAVAFAFIAHVNPLVGLYAAFMVCLITSAFGGRPGMISGATGALALVMVSIVIQHGIQYLFAAIILMGLIQLTCGILRLGKFIRIVPHSVMLGFVNGLAIIVFISQLGHFKITNELGNSVWLSGKPLYLMLGLVGLTMLIIYLFSKVTKIIPAPLAGIGIVFAVVQLLGIDTRSVGDMASIAGGLPTFHFPEVPFNFETLKIILPYSIILAAIGLLESLLTMALLDEVTETRGRKSRECMAQGSANIITGLFGGMGGCAMIGQSMINVASGARQRLSGIMAGLFLLSFILVGSPVIEKIPLAALAGVIFMVVIDTFGWSSIRIINKIPKSDAFIIIVVSVTTVFIDLASAVLIGVILSALVYAWKSSSFVNVNMTLDQEKNQKIYDLNGPLFFGSINSFKRLFDPKSDPDQVVVNFQNCRVWDHSGVEALRRLAERYQALGKKIRYKRLSVDCARLIGREGSLVEVDSDNDPHYEIVMDHKHKPGSH